MNKLPPLLPSTHAINDAVASSSTSSDHRNIDVDSVKNRDALVSEALRKRRLKKGQNQRYKKKKKNEKN